MICPFDDFTGRPRALVIAADRDPIRDGGREYAAKLVAAGIDTRFVEYPGTTHGIMSFGVPQVAGQSTLLDIRDFVSSLRPRSG